MLLPFIDHICFKFETEALSMLVSYFESPKFHIPSTELCSESVFMSSLCFPVTILIAAPGTSDV